MPKKALGVKSALACYQNFRGIFSRMFISYICFIKKPCVTHTGLPNMIFNLHESTFRHSQLKSNSSFSVSNKNEKRIPNWCKMQPRRDGELLFLCNNWLVNSNWGTNFFTSLACNCSREVSGTRTKLNGRDFFTY